MRFEDIEADTINQSRHRCCRNWRSWPIFVSRRVERVVGGADEQPAQVAILAAT